MRVISSIAIVSVLLCACQPIVPEQPPPATGAATGETPKRAQSDEPKPAQTPDPHADAMWPDMRFTEPLELAPLEMEWAVAAGRADISELTGTAFEKSLEDLLDGSGLIVFYYMLFLQVQAFCFEDSVALEDLIEQQAARVGPRIVAEAKEETYANPPRTRYIIATLLLTSWEEFPGYFCMDKACLAEVEPTIQCGEWLDTNLDCLLGEHPGECVERSNDS